MGALLGQVSLSPTVRFTEVVPKGTWPVTDILLAWPSLQSLAVKKNFFLVQILGGEKLLKFGEKWAVKSFWRPERG